MVERKVVSWYRLTDESKQRIADLVNKGRWQGQEGVYDYIEHKLNEAVEKDRSLRNQEKKE